VPSYPMITFLVRHGAICALVIALLAPIAGIYFLLTGAGWIAPVIGVIAGVILYGFLKSYSEMVSLMADMLMPK
jgi:hypothetical protein